MIGIDGVRVPGARDVEGEVELVVETTTDRDWCRTCGVRAHSKGRSVVVVVDTFGRRARLGWQAPLALHSSSLEADHFVGDRA